MRRLSARKKKNEGEINLLNTVLSVIRSAVTVPVTPAPQRRGSSSVVYRYYPSSSDGQLVSGRLELRFTAFGFAEAYGRMMDVRRALLGTDGAAVVGDGAARIIICESKTGAGSGYAPGCGLYYVKASFDLQGRGDIYG